MDGNFFTGLLGKPLNALFRNRQHTAGAASAIVNAVSRALDLIFNRYKGKISNQFHNITGRKMTSGIGDIRFLIEFSDNFFKHGPHRVVIQSRQFYTAIRVAHRTAAEVNGRVNKLGNQKPQNVMLGKLINLVSKLKFCDDILYIFAESIQI